MTSKRDIKKTINYITGELFSECLVQSLYVQGTNKEKADQLLGEILSFQDDYLRRINHIEPGNVKGFFKKLREEFDAKTNEFIDAIGKLN
jgi:hypothetical protein